MHPKLCYFARSNMPQEIKKQKDVTPGPYSWKHRH